MASSVTLWEGVKRWSAAGSLSLTIHLLLVALLVKLPAGPLPGKRVVPVEPVTLTTVVPKPAGGGGGGPAVAPQQLPPPVPKKEKPKPVAAKPKPQPKPVVKPPEPGPVPPSLAMAKPVPPPSSQATTTSTTAAASSSGYGSGSGTGFGSGSGRGSGSGVGSGSGSGRGTGSGSVLQGYLFQVRQLLEKNKHYPMLARRRHEEGVVVLRFVIHADGAFTSLQVARSSGHASLDEAAQETVQRVRRFPPLPSELQRSQLQIEVPLAFRLQSS